MLEKYEAVPQKAFIRSSLVKEGIVKSVDLSTYFRTSRKYCVVNVFRQTPIFVKLVFEVTVNSTNDGRTSKHAEYNYA